ncbi:hypothetical protein EGW08_004899 [Elysia chlorotica]|uniref:Fucosyltransferase n=1 Tax=Elysia chlorotica TaxID=188477 RepID=A0A433U0M4_ELYCH|nr:hypothetical protein EGW08_004899 [Elysia chlorotica]
MEGVQGPNGLARCNQRDQTGHMMRCEVTVDNRRFDQADAVVLYTHGKTHWSDLHFQPVKRPGTIWTFFAVESPINSRNSLFKHDAFQAKFNSTMTYRSDSEFWHGYIRSQRRPQPISAQQAQTQEAELRMLFRKKSKMAAVFVSNCNAASRRDDYIRILQRYIPVDVYGLCGPLRCDDRQKCDQMLRDDYKFYLAFENSHCFDYVTEKLLRILSDKSVVPVVRGGADYSRLMPKNSVIDTSAFSSPVHLAMHLKRLAENEDLWVDMFRWSTEWEVKGPDLPLCQYCHHLFSREELASPHLYPDVYKWWSEGTCYPVRDLPPRRSRRLRRRTRNRGF